MNRLTIETNDENFFEDLRKANIQGLTIMRHVYNVDSFNDTTFQQYFGVTIELLGGIGRDAAVGLLIVWLSKRFIENQGKKYTIEGSAIPKNVPQMQSMIRNYFQADKREEPNERKI
jgi:hypothetical protein